MNDGREGQEMPTVVIEDLIKNYGSVHAVCGINLEIQKGEIFGFLGPNGAGKSTTIQILCTLLSATSGHARIDGIDVAGNPRAVRSRIGLVFQEPSLDDQLTGRENLEFHARLYNMTKSDRELRIVEVLEMVGLSDKARMRVGTYSGGMKRRLEIARGILHKPAVLFLDEPTQGLDPQTRSHIWEYLKSVQEKESTTVFMTTHYMDEAEFCDRLAIIDHGVIVARGTPTQLKDDVGGDVVTVVTDDNDIAAEDMRNILSLEPVRGGDAIRVEVHDGAQFVPQLIGAITVPVQRVSVNRPTLDDVFLKLTGREIREEEAGVNTRARMMARRWSGGRH